MEEISISITIDENSNDITIASSNSKSITIFYSNKQLSAKEIYNVLAYSQECKYSVQAQDFNSEDANLKDYFNNIVSLLKDICEDINRINSTEEE